MKDNNLFILGIGIILILSLSYLLLLQYLIQDANKPPEMCEYIVSYIEYADIDIDTGIVTYTTSDIPIVQELECNEKNEKRYDRYY